MVEKLYLKTQEGDTEEAKNINEKLEDLFNKLNKYRVELDKELQDLIKKNNGIESSLTNSVTNNQKVNLQKDKLNNDTKMSEIKKKIKELDEKISNLVVLK